MKRFLIHLLICLIVIVALNFLYLFYVGGNLRQYETKYRGVPDSFSLLVLGDSHPERAWAANTNNQVYNLSFGSDNVIDMKYKFFYAADLNKYQGRKAVVLPFEPQQVSAYREKTSNNRVSSLLNDGPLNRDIIFRFPLFFDPYTDISVKKVLSRGKRDEIVRSFTKKKANSRFRQQFPEDTVSNKLLSEYQMLIDSIKSRGYEIIAIRYPLHPYYDSLVRSSPHTISLTRSIDSLAAVNNITIEDYSDKFTDPKLFVDQDHINLDGSRRLIDIFNKRYSY